VAQNGRNKEFCLHAVVGINLSAPEFYISILAHPVRKM